MKTARNGILKKLFCRETFSPRGFALRAAMIAAGYGICEMMGLREHTTVISGTTPATSGSLQSSAVWAAIYMLFHFGFVLVVPILLLASLLMVLTRRWWRSRGAAENASSNEQQEA